MRERQRHTLAGGPVRIEPGDTLKCWVWDRKLSKYHVFEEKIGRKLTVDTVVTFDIDEPIFGLEAGIGAIFGKATTDDKR